MGNAITSLGLETINADEVDEATGKLDLNSRGQLMIMLQKFTDLLKEKVVLDQKDFAQSPENFQERVLWHERLAKLDERYNLEQFVHLALDMNSEHPNLSIVNRILDILDALRQGQPQGYDMPQKIISPHGSEGSDAGSDARERLKQAFRQKLKEYQNKEESPTAVSAVKRAFLKKIRQK